MAIHFSYSKCTECTIYNKLYIQFGFGWYLPKEQVLKITNLPHIFFLFCMFITVQIDVLFEYTITNNYVPYK